MIDASTRINVGDNALIQKVSDEMVILDSQSGQYYTLNDMATEMLEQLRQNKTVNEVVMSICNEYEVEYDEVHTDLNDMINILVQKELISLA